MVMKPTDETDCCDLACTVQADSCADVSWEEFESKMKHALSKLRRALSDKALEPAPSGSGVTAVSHVCRLQHIFTTALTSGGDAAARAKDRRFAAAARGVRLTIAAEYHCAYQLLNTTVPINC